MFGDPHPPAALWAWLLLTLLPVPAAAASNPIPQALQAWEAWVLRDHPQAGCSRLPTDDRQRSRCHWPGPLRIQLRDDGADFTQDWLIQAPGYVLLPGGPDSWPDGVAIGDERAPVMEREQRPMVWLEAGLRRIQGSIGWTRPPQLLPVADGTALVTVSDAAGHRFNAIREGNRIWLAPPQGSTGGPLPDGGDRLQTQVFRKLVDDLPARLETRLLLDIAGAEREVLLGRLTGDGYLPSRLESPLPARIDEHGQLVIQARPGQWWITLEALNPEHPAQLGIPGDPPADSELWAFEPRPQVRRVRVEAASTPTAQTSMPEHWQGLAAYRLGPGQSIALRTLSRGAPPEPGALGISRHLWPDLAGGGAAFEDLIRGDTGALTRLEAIPALKLGRALVNGEPQSITATPESGQPGVQLAVQQLEAVISGRLDNALSIPLSGWSAPVRELSLTVEMPPGWKVLTFLGAEHQESGTWLSRWSLFDVFVLLLAVAAMQRTFGTRWAVVAAAALLLGGHRWLAPGSGLWIVLTLLALIHRRLGGNRSRAVYLTALLLMTVNLLAFSVQQLREAAYPQLTPWTSPSVSHTPSSASPEVPEERIASRARDAAPGAAPPATRLPRYDPAAILQTGAGLPRWSRHQRAHARWQGITGRQEEIRALVSPPWLSRAGSILSVALYGLLLVPFATLARSGGGGRGRRAAVAAVLLSAAGTSAAADFPPPQLLQELRQQLLQPAPCEPDCVAIQNARVGIDPDAGLLTVELEAFAQAAGALALPGTETADFPASVSLDPGAAVNMLRDDRERLWLHLQPGWHQVTVHGHWTGTAVSLSFGHHIPRVLELGGAPGWRATRSADSRSVSFTSLAAAGPEDTPASRIPAFLSLRRELELGIQWSGSYRLRRLSDHNAALAVRIPLLAGESVLSSGVQVQEDGVAVVSLPAGSDGVSWRTRLEPRSRLELRAGGEGLWNEQWIIDAWPIWQLREQGLAPTARHAQGMRRLSYQPLAGESVTLEVMRPAAVQGPVLTAERVQSHMTPGTPHRGRLQATLRAGQGIEHVIEAPAGVSFRTVTLNAAAIPLLNPGRMELTVPPGESELRVEWEMPDSATGLHISSPAFDLGMPAANIETRLAMPNRWILGLHGPALGPAILWYGVLVVIALLAIGLGRWGATPLGTVAWLVLGIGFSASHPWAFAALILLLSLLRRRGAQLLGEMSAGRGVCYQIAIPAAALVVTTLYFESVRSGLLGRPDMHINGPNSGPAMLYWYQDWARGPIKAARVTSLPLIAYNILMMIWALYAAIATTRLSGWAWQAYSRGGVWNYSPRLPRFKARRDRQAPQASATPPAD